MPEYKKLNLAEQRTALANYPPLRVCVYGHTSYESQKDQLFFKGNPSSLHSSALCRSIKSAALPLGISPSNQLLCTRVSKDFKCNLMYLFRNSSPSSFFPSLLAASLVVFTLGNSYNSIGMIFLLQGYLWPTTHFTSYPFYTGGHEC